MLMHFSCVRPFFSFLLWCVMCCTMAPKVHKSTPARNPFQGFGSSSSNLIPPPPSTFVSMMRWPQRSSWRTSKNVAFIWSARLSCRILPTLLFSLSFRLGAENLFLSVSCGDLLCLYQCFYSNIHGIDTSVPRFAITFRDTRIVVTSDLISEVLHVSRVVYPEYPGCEGLRTVSSDELLSHFCETSSIWGGKLNTPWLGFARGPRFLNMVMAFTLTPLSH